VRASERRKARREAGREAGRERERERERERAFIARLNTEFDVLYAISYMQAATIRRNLSRHHLNLKP
jgi:hypothetical protein